MIANRIANLLGLSDAQAKGLIVLVLACLSGVIAAEFPSAPWLAPLTAFVTGVAALIDPNATH